MPDKAFSGRTAIITGSARGIGKAIAMRLAEEGAAVVINYERDAEAAGATLKQIEEAGGRGIVVQANVASPPDIDRMVATTRRQLGPIDFLVNNAGIAETLTHSELTFAGWKRMMDVNLDGPFLATWAVKDEMIQRHFGRIVNVSSLAGLIKKKGMIHYATAKSAVISFTRHCAEAFAPHNVRVNCVAPGLTDTNLAQTANPDQIRELIGITPMGRMAQPEEIAAVVRFLLSEESSFVTGQTIAACGGRN